MINALHFIEHRRSHEGKCYSGDGALLQKGEDHWKSIRVVIVQPGYPKRLYIIDVVGRTVISILYPIGGPSTDDGESKYVE